MLNISQEIEKTKRRLIMQTKKKGLCDNFGQKEVRKLQDKYAQHLYMNDGIYDVITKFEEWCMNYEG